MQPKNSPQFRGTNRKPGNMAFIVLAFSLLSSMGAMGNDKTVKVTMQENGKSVTLQKGNLLEVTLPASLGTGFSWHLQEDSQMPISIKGKPEIKKPENDKPQVGATEYQVFQFEAKAVGTGKLKLNYQRPWEKEVPPAKIYSLTVIVK